jgi:hypothetical protein
MDTKKLVYKGTELIIDRRQRERCPMCQFFTALIFILVASLLMLFLLNALPRWSSTNEFLISFASTYEVNDQVLIDADLKMNFSEDVVDALENGIPLTIAVQLKVFQQNPWWWSDEVIKESLKRFELRYHPLTNVHEVKNLANNVRYSFNSREDAMVTLGTIRGATLIEKSLLDNEHLYYVQMRTRLDTSYLPSALRPVASLSSSWRLESPWYRWTIDQHQKKQQKNEPAFWEDDFSEERLHKQLKNQIRPVPEE